MFLPAHVLSRAGYTQFVHGLIGSEACRVGSRGGQLPAFLSGFHCECFASGGKTLFEEGVFTSVPPNVSRWVMHTVEQGYRGALPPPFNRVTPTLVGPEQALVMEQEVSNLLRK